MFMKSWEQVLEMLLSSGQCCNEDYLEIYVVVNLYPQTQTMKLHYAMQNGLLFNLKVKGD